MGKKGAIVGLSSSDVAARLRQDILSGRLGPGVTLGQVELAERFGVSRIPIRDALAQLTAERLVDSAPRRGARVVQLGPEGIGEAFDLRQLLEVDCLRRSIANLSEPDLDRITHEARRCELEAGRPEFPDADWKFHLALYAPSRRPQAIRMIRELRQTCRSHHASYDRLRDKKDRWNDNHDVIVEACRNDDVDGAEAALRSHLDGAREALLAAMPKHEDPPHGDHP